MRRVLMMLLLAAVILPSMPKTGLAAPSSEIISRVTRVRDSIWRYDYTLVNKATALNNNTISLFDTFFPYGCAKNIGASLMRAGNGWRARCGEQAPSLTGRKGKLGERTDEGFYSATARNAGKALRAGKSLSGFSVEFEWLGPDLPGEQDYLAIHTFDRQAPRGPTIGDLRGFPPNLPPPVVSYYEEGRTRLDPSVPEPVTIALLGGGLLGFIGSRRRKLDAS